MKIFKKKTVQTSNDYYEAYKAELSGQVERKKFFSLNNILKLEILVVAVGFIMLNQNNLSLELKKIYVSENNILPMSMQYASLDEDLVVELEETQLEKVKIREDDIIVTSVLDKEMLVNNVDIKLLIELLKVEIKEKKESV